MSKTFLSYFFPLIGTHPLGRSRVSTRLYRAPSLVPSDDSVVLKDDFQHKSRRLCVRLSDDFQHNNPALDRPLERPGMGVASLDELAMTRGQLQQWGAR